MSVSQCSVYDYECCVSVNECWCECLYDCASVSVHVSVSDRMCQC